LPDFYLVGFQRVHNRIKEDITWVSQVIFFGFGFGNLELLINWLYSNVALSVGYTKATG